VGFTQHDPVRQPLFFVNNPAPDFNSYHMPNTGAAPFIYDNNTSGQNAKLTFTEYQAHGADVHGTIDAKYNEGFPTVRITSPADGTTINNPVVIAATASDSHGISKVEFYVDWKLESTITSPPYNFDWSNATTGTHTVAAMAYSDAGINACYAVTLKK
jgi:Bacterial Ig domain